MKNIINIIGFLVLLLISASSLAEGTKQWSLSSTDYTFLKVNPTGTYAFAGYGVAANKRLHIHIANPGSEKVYIGLSRMVNEPANTDITTSYNFQIRSPSGAIVHGPYAVSSPNITSHAMAAAGPAALVAGGYPTTAAMWTFTPSVAGDYYIEFDTAGSIRWFDITVADTTLSSPINGRVWSQAWAVRADNGYTSTANAFDTPFNGKLIAYDGQYATLINFENSGLRPLEGQFSFNSTGPGNTGNKANDRKSVVNQNSTNPLYKIFLNQPDPDVYPLDIPGELQNLPLTVDNPNNPEIKLNVTQPGKVELLLDFGGGTNDRRLFADVVAGVNKIPWDGQTGTGNPVHVSDYPIPVNIAYTQGETHFTAYDVEGLDNGFQVYTQTSMGTTGPNLLFWDDSNIAYAPGSADPQVNVDTGSLVRRRWTNTSYGDLNTINTWWYAYRTAQTSTVMAPGDYGDAPDSYGDAFHSNPASTSVFLGNIRPDEETTSLNAANGGVDGTGDDSSQTDNDEDSITAFPSLKVGSTGYSLDNIPLSNTSGGAATLYGWVDFNQNGQFDGNEVATASVPAGAVSATLNWTGLSGVTAGASYVRLRLTTQALTNTNSATPASIDTRSYGAANDGEVEDYALTITALDYGDAPSNMSSIDASLGAVYGDAWHSMTGNVMLGSSIDGESASQSAGLLANGDGGDDDGVAFPLIDTTPVLRAGEGNTLTITAGSAGYLNAWIDWNQDGDWSDVGEQVATNTQLNAGANTRSLTPALTAPHGATYARFRFTSASVATPTPTGAAVDGEVEDYRVSIVLPKPVAACFGIGNSGFEEPALATSMDFPPEDTVPYWGTIAVDPASGSNFSARNAIEIWTSGFNGVPAFQGQQFAELNAHVAGMLYQDIETDPGTVLHWSFAHRGRQTNETLNLLVGSPGAEILQRSVTTGTAGWLVYSGTYTVPAGQKITRFGFQAANGGSLGNFLDAISFSAECPDWSDAPASYADVSHQKVAGIQLGASVTNDPGPYQSANADGDVSDDGVSIPTLAQGQTATITATVSGAGGYLQGWVDWNGNGNFNDSGEQVALNLQDNGAGDSNAAAGTIAFTLNVPANAATSQTFARFRWSTTNNLNGTAAANDGEVEDYALTILAKGIISGTVFRDDDQSNVKDGAETGIDLITVQLYNDNGTPTDVSDDTLAATIQTSGGGTYSFPDLDPGSYLLRVDTADADLPAGALIGTTHPQTGITVTAGNTTTVNFGFDIFTCVPGGGTADGAVTAYISKEVEGGSVAARSEADTLDDAWRSAAGLPTSGTQLPWLGTASATMGSSAPALFKTYGVAVDVASVNIQPSSPCLGSASSASTYLSTGSTLQASAPRPASLYNSAAQPAFWYDAGGDSQSPNAVRFTFAEPVKSFGAWFGDLETRSDGNARPAWLRLLDSSGNQIGQDISIEPADISSGAGATAVDQNLCGSTAPGTDNACGNTSTRWVGFVDSTASARIKHVLVIVGDDDFGDDAGTELISFIGMDIVQEDYGDAPGSYGDAIHWLSLMPKLYLGSASPDKEDQSQNAAHGGADGSGDDADGSDDEDGVANFPVLANGDKDYSLNVTVNNTSGSTAQLVGWIDFNHNGVFDSTEAATVAVPTGANNRITALTWNNLPGDTQPGSSYLRLRLTTDSSIAAGMASTSLPTGTAEDGEVEDYAITIGDSGYTVSGTVYNDANVNGSNDAEDGIKDVTVVLYDTAGNTCRSSKTGADGSYSFSGVQPAAADNYVLYEAADESHEAPETCPPAASDPNGYASSTANSQTITVSTANVSGVDFGDVKVPTFMLENSQVILPNTTVAYPHMFRSAADGAVTFTLTESADPSRIEWGTSLYLDNNCDAALDAGDTAITGSITVNAGDKLCILTKVLAPANATAGAQHSLDVTSSFVYGDGSVITLAAEQTRTDITSTSSGTSSDPVGGEGKLSLVKSVWNASRGTAVGDNDGSVALPGETLRYTIAYENIGNGELDELVVHDSVPAFTQLGGVGQACGATPPELSACTPVSNGESLDWSFTGKLQAGSSGNVYYEVVVE